MVVKHRDINCFSVILILVSQRAEVQAIQLFGPEWMVKELEKELLKQRGNAPTFLELIVVVYVFGKSNLLRALSNHIRPTTRHVFSRRR